jgi:hypothetical protein
MNHIKQLQLLKAADYTWDDVGESEHPIISSLMSGAGINYGLKGLSAANPMLRGKHRFYHGTSADAVDQIKQQGIQTMGQRGDGSVTAEALDEATWDKSKDMAFLEKQKRKAKVYAQQANIKARNPGLDLQGVQDEVPANNIFKLLFGKDSQSVLPVEIDTQNMGKVVRNPEYDSFKKQMDFLNITPEDGGKVKLPLGDLIAKQMFGSSRGVEGGVDASEIVGGKGYKAMNWKGMKSNPLRVLAGLGLGSGSAGLAGLSTKNLYDTWMKDPSFMDKIKYLIQNPERIKELLSTYLGRLTN